MRPLVPRRPRGFPRSLALRSLVIVALVLVGLLVVLPGIAESRRLDLPELRIAGQGRVVFTWKRDACAPDEMPDTPARAFRDDRGRVQLLIVHQQTRRFVGSSFDRLRHDCTVVFGSDGNPDPAAFADQEWLEAPYAIDGGRTVVALVHDEYQGQLHRGRCRSGVYMKCWYNAVTLAISHDGGSSYQHAPPPQQLVAALPYKYVPDRGPVGLFEPSNIVRSPSDGLYYAVVQVTGPNRKPSGTCLMRTANLLDPGSWRAWDGTGFGLRFVNPYRESGGTVCTVVSKPEIADMNESLTFNTTVGKFLLVGASSASNPVTGRKVPGIYYSFSDDLVTWSQRRLLLAAQLPWTVRCKGKAPLAYPAALDPASPSRNFETTGSRFFLYLTRFNGGCHLTSDRDLIRLPIRLVSR
jgi:hypothetical protein